MGRGPCCLHEMLYLNYASKIFEYAQLKWIVEDIVGRLGVYLSSDYLELLKKTINNVILHMQIEVAQNELLQTVVGSHLHQEAKGQREHFYWDSYCWVYRGISIGFFLHLKCIGKGFNELGSESLVHVHQFCTFSGLVSDSVPMKSL